MPLGHSTDTAASHVLNASQSSDLKDKAKFKAAAAAITAGHRKPSWHHCFKTTELPSKLEIQERRCFGSGNDNQAQHIGRGKSSGPRWMPLVANFEGIRREVRESSSTHQHGGQADPARHQSAAVILKHPREQAADHPKVRGTKEYPPERYGKERGRAAHGARRPSPRFHKTSVQYQENAVIAAPQDKSPVCAVPQSAEEHGDEQIAGRFPGALAAPAHRNVEIVAQASGKRNVPATPEISDIGSLIGRIEILGQPQSEHVAQSDRHVAITGKIKIQL